MASNFKFTGDLSTYEFLNDKNLSCDIKTCMKEDFKENGYVIIKNLYKPIEAEKIVLGVENSKEFQNALYGLEDKEKLKYYMNLWVEPGNDVLGRATKTQKMIGVAEQLLDKGELYMFHGKFIMKHANTGGAFVWHQDYGYWYNNGCIFPDMISVFVALTKNDETNGGLELLKGSHKCGRIDGTGNKLDKLGQMALIEPKLKLVKCNFMPGDAIFFHANILHRSHQNKSEHKRWNIIWSFNTKYNNPDPSCYDHSAPYSPLERLPIDAVEKCENLELETRKYLDPTLDRNVTVKK